jgi:hypothetical protein
MPAFGYLEGGGYYPVTSQGSAMRLSRSSEPRRYREAGTEATEMTTDGVAPGRVAGGQDNRVVIRTPLRETFDRLLEAEPLVKGIPGCLNPQRQSFQLPGLPGFETDLVRKLGITK